MILSIHLSLVTRIPPFLSSKWNNFVVRFTELGASNEIVEMLLPLLYTVYTPPPADRRNGGNLTQQIQQIMRNTCSQLTHSVSVGLDHSHQRQHCKQFLDSIVKQYTVPTYAKWIVFVILLNLFWALGIFKVLSNTWPCPPAWHHFTGEHRACPFLTVHGHSWFNYQRRRLAPPPFSYLGMLYSYYTPDSIICISLMG